MGGLICEVTRTSDDALGRVRVASVETTTRAPVLIDALPPGDYELVLRREDETVLVSETFELEPHARLSLLVELEEDGSFDASFWSDVGEVAAQVGAGVLIGLVYAGYAALIVCKVLACLG